MINITKLRLGAATDDPVVLMDGPTNRKTIRAAASGIELTIAHQGSNENPGFETQRTNLRLTLTKPAEDTTKSVSMYVQVAISVPKTEFTLVELSGLVAKLVNLIALGGDPSSAGYEAATFQATTIASLYAGEP